MRKPRAASSQRGAAPNLDADTCERDVRLRAEPVKASTRRLGAVTGLAFGLVSLAPFALDQQNTTMGVVGAMVCMMATVFGWIFAPHAVRPTRFAGLRVAAEISLTAVPVGALLVSVLATVGNPGQSITQAIGGVLFVLLAGLALLGLPAVLVTTVVASGWAIVVREISRRRG